MRSGPILLIPLALATSALAQEDAENPDWVALQDAAQAFVKAFNAGDAGAVGALLTPDAEMVRRDGSRVSGRKEITAFYEGVFARNPEAKVALEASSLRFLSPRLAVEDGTLHVTRSEGEEPVSVLYTTLHVKQDDGSWLMARSRDREPSNAAIHDHLAGIDGLVGNWVGNTDGGALKLAVAWDQSGSYLLAKADYSAAGVEPITATMRIGWNSLTNKINSWTFDQHGGFSQAEWTDTDEAWILKARGYTNEGETTSSTITLQPTSEDSFNWIVTDKIIGDEVHDDRSLRMVRQPPEPKFSTK